MTRSCAPTLAASAFVLAVAMPAVMAQPTDGETADGTTKDGKSSERVQLDSGEWIEVDSTEVIEVFAERPTKPVKRDTQLRLTGAELLARGVTNLAEALDTIPQLQVRQAGRGGIQVNIRGGRKGAIKVLIDGVPVDEVFYGTFDISSIPVTDIAQIRVSMSPSSPLDGVGGPAGVIEVHTLDAVGDRLIRLRAQGSSLPQADLSATARTELADGIAVRGSASAGLGRRDFEVATGDAGAMIGVNEDRRQFTGAIRMEMRRERERLVIDAFAQQRGFLVPPGEDGSERIVVIDSESSTRFSALGDIERGAWKLQGRAYVQTLDRMSLKYTDPSLTDEPAPEHVIGTRAGAGFVANRPLGKSLQLLAAATIDNENGELDVPNGITDGSATISELAAGAQSELGPFEIDAAVGVALPLGDAGDAPWPEGKLSVGYSPLRAVDLKLIVGRKGRLPTLRERYRADIGNPDLDPEVASFIEVETTVKPSDRVKLRSSAYVRDSDGMIRFDSGAVMLINVNDLIVRGFDTDGDVDVAPFASVGGSYGFTDSYSPQFGLDSLDFLPRHRIEGRVSARHRRGSARLRVRYTSTQIDQQTKLPARTTVDASAFARISENLQASLRLDNVFGSKVPIRRGGVMSPGRVLMLSLQSSWQ